MPSAQVSELDQNILDARSSEYGLDRLIEANRPYVQSRVLRFAPHTDYNDRDDLTSIALLAFYEAVRAYSPEKGHFYPFADVVLQRRIIDEIRRNSRSEQELAVLDSDDEGEDDYESGPIVAASLDLYEQSKAGDDLAIEIRQFVSELSEMGITLDSLEKHSPKHAALKELYMEILRKIRYDNDVCLAIFEKHYYPIKKIFELTHISLKKLERSRIYIIAAMLILRGDYPGLAEFIPVEREVGQ